MPVIRRARPYSVLALVLGACGPSSSEPKEEPEVPWLLGVFSETTPEGDNIARDHAAVYEFREDHTVELRDSRFGNRIIVVGDFSWEAETPLRVRIDEIESNEPRQVVIPGADCNTLLMGDYSNGQPPDPEEDDYWPFHRGEICVRVEDPDAIGGSYEHYYCDGKPPPPCADEG